MTTKGIKSLPNVVFTHKKSWSPLELIDSFLISGLGQFTLYKLRSGIQTSVNLHVWLFMFINTIYMIMKCVACYQQIARYNQN